jgi:retron-type reverse transcriptase
MPAPIAQLKRAAAVIQQPAAPAQPAPAATPRPAATLAPAPPATLKPHHRRLVVPGAGAATAEPARPQRRRLRGADARRWFSATLRTRSRQLRGLTTDENQLVRYGLPVWRAEAELAQALEVDVKTLRHFSAHSARDRSSHYVTFAIPKRSGGERLIMAPKSRLKALQRQLVRLLVSKLPVSEYAHGFRAGHSVRSNAQSHVGKGVILRLDIQDFFPALHYGRVRGLMIALGYGYEVATVLAVLMTESPRQPVSAGETRCFAPVGPRACPQGAPTSPGISNALLVKMDRRLAGLARRYGFSYTRYADDLIFSGEDLEKVHALRHLAARVVREEGFVINRDKTRVMRRGSRQTVTGVTVNDVLGLSRRERRRLRAALHQASQWEGGGLPSPLRGMLAYVSMLNPSQAARLSPKT